MRENEQGIIREQLRFETFNDFYVRRKIMREIFGELDRKEREIYKYYVYANSILSMVKKDIIWEYLTEPKTSPYYVWERDLARYYNKSNNKSNNKSERSGVSCGNDNRGDNKEKDCINRKVDGENSEQDNDSILRGDVHIKM